MRVQPSERYHSASELAAAVGKVPLQLDWLTNSKGGGAYNWHAARTHHRDLEVELSEDPSSGWRTRVWTISGGERRKRNVTDYWRRKLGYKQALKHLTAVFGDLSR
jgi:hypothetical protein